MNAQEITEIRNLTSDEMEDVSGALMFRIGSVRIQILEGEMIFSVSVDGVGSLNIDTGGAWAGAN